VAVNEVGRSAAVDTLQRASTLAVGEAAFSGANGLGLAMIGTSPRHQLQSARSRTTGISWLTCRRGRRITCHSSAKRLH